MTSITQARDRSTTSYTVTARVLHWLIAVGILGMFGLGLYMVNLPLSPTKLKLYSWHKWAGISIFLLALIRVLWRIRHQAPALPKHYSPFVKTAAHVGHMLLYVLMFLAPLSGWLMSSAKGVQTVWFGVLPLPDVLPENKALGDALLTVHQTVNYVFMATVAGHALAALKHHFIDRDNTLRRMLFMRSS